MTHSLTSLLPGAQAVRFVVFNKTKNTNWALPWHQDRVIAVEKNVDINGYGNWSRKSGFWHCEPPVEILENMLAVRIHLDDADERTGALEIAKGSHTYGKVLADQTETVIKACQTIRCDAQAGDVLIMKMLALHRSKVSMSDAPRRAIRIDYSADTLPAPLRWQAS